MLKRVNWPWVFVGGGAVLLLAGGLMLARPAGSVSGQTPPAEQPAANDETDNTRNRADALWGEQKWAEAAGLYRELAEKNEKDVRSWFRLGYALHAAGKYEEAAEIHEYASQFQTVRATALYNLACAKALLGKKDESISALNRAIDAGFNDRRLVAEDADFKSLADDPAFTKVLERLAESAVAVYRQFDFWVGTWKVVNQGEKQIGTNTVQSLENGRMLLENWDNGNGGTGKSMNFVDPADGKWHQIWIDGSGGVTRYVGEYTDGAMRFEGVAVNSKGGKELSRMTFTPMDDGRVRQYVEHSKDDGETWYVYFDGYYVKQE